ncbi:hypothetical protein BD414DRAFT_485487 [Trametes punicea]|nr:hypothetical protein BD414DRAFT_485487 [Trametes punicea]
MGSWSDHPEANYVMIEPNVKYMLYTEAARANPPLAWYERPPPVPRKVIRVDKMRFLPSRRLQNAFSDEPWVQTVADDLDSFTHVFLHTLLFRGKQRKDGSTESLSWAFRALGKTHPQRLQDWRDEVEQSVWQLQEKVKEERAKGKEPDGASVDAIAEQLYQVMKVNIRQHGMERELQWRRNDEGVKERWRGQYEEYLKAMRALAEAAEKATLRAEEERRKKAERKALEKAAKRQREAEGTNESVAMPEAQPSGMEEMADEDVEMDCVEEEIGGAAAARMVDDHDERDEPSTKRARLM